MGRTVTVALCLLVYSATSQDVDMDAEKGVKGGTEQLDNGRAKRARKDEGPAEDTAGSLAK